MIGTSVQHGQDNPGRSQGGIQEKDPKVIKRMAAINMVCMNGQSIRHTADSLMQCPDWVSMWVERFKKGGIDALRDLPHTGRPPKVNLEVICDILAKTDDKTTPKKLRDDVRKEARVSYHITSVRRILHRLGMSAKTVKVHINRADMDEIKKWQHNTKRRISRLERRGFVTVVYDESIFINDPKAGAKYWSPVGQSITATYTGNHDKVIVYGSIAIDGRQFFRSYEKFDRDTTLRYIKELSRHFGKVAIVMDNAPQHKARIVKSFLKRNPNVKVIWLPTATPELSVIEEYWHQSKRDILVSEYYGTFGKMKHALSEYLRTHRTDLDPMKFICRSFTPKKL